MISITERKTEKVVGETSLFLSFEYKKEHVDFIHTLPGCNFSKRTHLWEIPLVYLSKVLDYFCQVDDLELSLLPDPHDSDDPAITVDTSSYKLKPFDFQVEAIEYGLNHKRWLLLDPPGLGKTATIIHIVEELLKSNQLHHCLVVCGLNTIKENWKEEVKKHSDLSCMILGQRLKRDGSYIVDGISKRIEQLASPIKETIVITNIETIRNNDIVELIENGPNKFELIVCDEIHKVKNSSSQQGHNFLKLIKHERKIGATGTLLMNSPLDAYVPLSWIGVERATETNFKYFYCKYNNRNLVGYQNIDHLKDVISNHSLRRSKDLLKLPPLQLINEYVEMEPPQKKLYEEVAEGIRSQVDKVKLNKSNVLSLVGRLRQVTACPSILTTKDIPSAKIDRCCDLVEQIVSGGEKVLIFSTFKETVEVLRERLKQYHPLVGTGDIPEAEINKNVQRFQNDSYNKCFIATWQKMGTGLTLTAATYVIFIDTAWTSADVEQHYSRAYRAGTSKSVTVYFLITRGTIDEKVDAIVHTKQAISDYIIDDSISDEGFEILKKYIQQI